MKPGYIHEHFLNLFVYCLQRMTISCVLGISQIHYFCNTRYVYYIVYFSFERHLKNVLKITDTIN